MYLKKLSLQNFRSYAKAQFSFDPKLTIIIGPNASGKSNLVEAIGILATGKSFRTSKEKQLLAFGEQIARVEGAIGEEGEKEQREITFFTSTQGVLHKRYLVNGISRRRSSLSGKFPLVLFTPLDLAIVAGQPGERRRFLDEVLEQTDERYALALQYYSKALRQRNALLEYAQKRGRSASQRGERDEERFAYWDNLLITHGAVITQIRESFITYINSLPKELFQFTLLYDKSLMSSERLLQYKDAEVGAGMTLVGPQRDDVIIQTLQPLSNTLEDVKYFCSRGQQRLVTLELKKIQISYLQEHLETQPLLVLDDIFSELDNEHIRHVLALAHDFQTIITTTHKEFVNDVRKKTAVIELEGKI